MQKDVEDGVTAFKERVQAFHLNVDRLEPVPGRTAYYIALSKGGKETDFVLTWDFFKELKTTPAHLLALNEYLDAAASRLENPSPDEFFAKSGTPLNIQIYWPPEAFPNKAASYLRVYAKDVRYPALIAKTAVVVGWMVDEVHGRNPFARVRTVVNRIREATDRGEIQFFAEATHPATFQMLEVPAPKAQSQPPSDTEVQQFLVGKVFWLGFKRGDKNTRVWIADPWDAEYLGCSSLRDLTQAAQILEARQILKLDSAGTFATVGAALLVNPPAAKPSPKKGILVLGGGNTEAGQIYNLLKNTVSEEISVFTSNNVPTQTGVPEDVRSLIERADLVFADVSVVNPNTMYEIGFAHALKKQVVLLVDGSKSKTVPNILSGLMFLPYDPGSNAALQAVLGNVLRRYLGSTGGE
jgi:hypothetical protein